jgi:hypothetical protein
MQCGAWQKELLRGIYYSVMHKKFISFGIVGKEKSTSPSKSFSDWL